MTQAARAMEPSRWRARHAFDEERGLDPAAREGADGHARPN